MNNNDLTNAKTNTSVSVSNTTISTTKDNIFEKLIKIRLLINSKYVGGVIGVGGKSITKIRQISQAFVKIDNQHSGLWRVCCIKGIFNQVITSIILITDKIAEETLTRKCNHHITILIDEENVDYLKGNKNTFIKYISDKTGAAVYVSRETLNNSTEKTIDISAKKESFTQAITEIVLRMITNPNRIETKLAYNAACVNYINNNNNSKLENDINNNNNNKNNIINNIKSNNNIIVSNTKIQINAHNMLNIINNNNNNKNALNNNNCSFMQLNNNKNINNNNNNNIIDNNYNNNNNINVKSNSLAINNNVVNINPLLNQQQPYPNSLFCNYNKNKIKPYFDDNNDDNDSILSLISDLDINDIINQTKNEINVCPKDNKIKMDDFSTFFNEKFKSYKQSQWYYYNNIIKHDLDNIDIFISLNRTTLIKYVKVSESHIDSFLLKLSEIRNSRKLFKQYLQHLYMFGYNDILILNRIYTFDDFYTKIINVNQLNKIINNIKDATIMFENTPKYKKYILKQKKIHMGYNEIN